MLDNYFDFPNNIQSDNFSTPSNSRKNPQNIVSIPGACVKPTVPGTGVLRPVRIASVVPSVPRTIDSFHCTNCPQKIWIMSCWGKRKY